MRRQFLGLGLGLLAVVVVGVLILFDDPNHIAVESQSDFALAIPSTIEGFARAVEPYDWTFPGDYGPHPDFQTEWWYYTGNLADSTGQRFGYQFTIFRRALTSDTVESDSEWRTGQVYLAHFSLTDVTAQAFYHEERLSRGSAGVAGATINPVYRVWLGSWEVVAEHPEGSQTRIHASSDEFAVNLTLEQVKPPALQGDQGLSPKSDILGNASYYYSLSRLETTGSILVGGSEYVVSGSSWMDHEFSTSALGSQAQGWDWFGLQLDDNRELMLGQIRLIDGGVEPAFGGLLVESDGSTRYLDAEDFVIEAVESWESPHTQAVYPAEWVVSVQVGEDESLRLQIRPLVADQEIQGAGTTYWEGAVEISGDASGYGYAELTGYLDVMQGRF